ncbi:MAG: hypothetical protein GX958_05755 [Desulfitobacterium sp.]|nr:hypothetical protein [Desulfitobacterium sp.]
MDSNFRLIGRVTFIHIATYILCGIVFSMLFDYESLYALEGVKSFMRPVSGESAILGPLVQVVRGMLFGVVLLLGKELFTSKYGWLKLWLFILILGIINTPGPAPSSIEGMIYTQLPLEFHLNHAPELIVQTLLFSYLAAKPRKPRYSNSFIEKNKTPFITSILAGFGISLSGIVLTLILKLDPLAGTKDIGAFVVMFAAMLITYFATKWYCTWVTTAKTIIMAFVYYLAVAVMPTVYNFMVDSPFKSLLPLAINIVPVVIMLLYLVFSGGRDTLHRM